LDRYPFNAISERNVESGLTTRMVIVPVEAVEEPPKKPGFIQIIEGIMRGGKHKDSSLWDRSDVAVCFTFRVSNLPPNNQADQLSGVVIVSPGDAQKIGEEFVNDPKRHMSGLLLASNGGKDLKMDDGKAVQIDWGTKGVLLPNHKFGGSLQESVITKAF
jgi:hypothetical protein